MRLLLLLAIGALGSGVAGWALWRGGRAARYGAVVGVLALVALTVAAFLIREGRLTEAGSPEAGVFEGHLVGTGYLRLVMGLWGLQGLLLVAAAALLGGLDRLRGLLPALLAAMTGGAVAMASADLAVGAAAAAAGGVAALLVILAVEGPAAVAAGARELRVTLLGGAGLLVAMGVVPLVAQLVFIDAGLGAEGPGPAASASSVATPAMGLVTVGIALVVAARWGMLPFHLRVSRLADLVPSETLPLLLAWGAVPMTVVALAAIDRLVAPLALPLDGERSVLVALAFATLVGAALAAFVHDDLRHATAYLVIADAGLLLLAIAALDPAAWGPGRAWLVALAASKTALLAWGAVTEDRFSTRSIPDLRGWIRRSPLLAAALVTTTVATFGLPGWVALDARVGLADAAAGSPWRELLILAGFLTLPTYLRLLGTGVGRATSRVDGAPPERVARRRKPREVLPVEQERVAAPAPEAAATPATAAAGSPATASATPDDAGPAPVATTTGRRRPRPGGIPGLPSSRAATSRTIQEILVRDRAELLSATVLALAVLAALTSWGALDLEAAAAEPAPILLTGAGD